jgi:hypothetical protein
MVNDDGGDFFQRWKIMKLLEALQQSQKAAGMRAGSRVGLRELLLRIRWRKRLVEFVSGIDRAESRISGTLD